MTADEFITIFKPLADVALESDDPAVRKAAVVLLALLGLISQTRDGATADAHLDALAALAAAYLAGRRE